MYIYLCVDAYVHVCTYMRMYVYACARVYVCVHICMSTRVCICISGRVCMYTCAPVWFVFIYIYAFVCGCLRNEPWRHFRREKTVGKVVAMVVRRVHMRVFRGNLPTYSSTHSLTCPFAHSLVCLIAL